MGTGTSKRSRGLECALDALRADDDARLAQALNGMCCTGVSSDSSFVIESGRGRWDLMHVAGAYGAVRCISLLCDRGSRVDICGGPDKLLTPLMVAAAAGQDAAGVSLLAHGADVTARDGAGHTAVRYAAWAGSWKLVHAMATCRPSQAPPGVVHVRDIATAFTATAEAALAAATVGARGVLAPERRLAALTRLVDKFPSLADKSRVAFDVNDLSTDGSSLLALALDAAPAVPPAAAPLHRRLVLHLLQRGARLVSQLSAASSSSPRGGGDPGVVCRRLDALLALLMGDADALHAEVSSPASTPASLYARYLRPLKALNWAYVPVGDAGEQAAAQARVAAAVDRLRAVGVPDLYAYPVFGRLLAGDTAGAVALLPPGDPARLAVVFDRYECPTLMTPAALQHGDSALTAAVRLRNYAVFTHILAAVRAARERQAPPHEEGDAASEQQLLLRRLAAVIDGDGPVDRCPLAAAISPAQPFAAVGGPQPPGGAAAVPPLALEHPVPAAPGSPLRADAAAAADGDDSAHADGSRGGSSSVEDDDDAGSDAGSASASPLLRASSLSSTSSAAAAAAPSSPAVRSAGSVRAVPFSSEADVSVRKAMIADLLGAGACPDVAVTFVARPCQDSLEYRHEVTGVAHAALSGDADTVVALLRAGATPNGCDVERVRPKPLSSYASSAAVTSAGGGGSLVGFAEDTPAVPGVLEAMRAYIQYLPRLKKLRHTRRGYRLIAAARDAFMALLPVILAESRTPLRAVAADFVAYAPPGRVECMLALVRGGANPCTPFTLTGRLELGGADTLLRKAVRRGAHAADVAALLDACADAGHDLLASENASNLRARLPEAAHRQLVRTAGVLDFDPRAPPGPQRTTEAGMSASTRLALHHALLEAWLPLTEELTRAYEDGVTATEEEAAAAAAAGTGAEEEAYTPKHPEDRQLVADVPVFAALHAAVRWSAAAGLPLAERRARQLEFTGLLLGRGAALSGEGWRRVLVTAVALCNEPLAVLLAAAKPSAAEAADAAARAALEDGAASPTSPSAAAEADAAVAADTGTPLAASRHAANASTFFYPVSPDGDVERQEKEWASDDPRGYRAFRNWLAADRRARLQPWAAAVAAALRAGRAPFDALRDAQARVDAAGVASPGDHDDAHDHTLTL